MIDSNAEIGAILKEGKYQSLTDSEKLEVYSLARDFRYSEDGADRLRELLKKYE